MLGASSTFQVLTTLQAAGLELILTSKRALKVTPASSLTPPLRELIKVHRDDLVGWLAMPASNDPANHQPPEPKAAPAALCVGEAICVARNVAVSNPVTKKTANWKALDEAYQVHHFRCPTCIAAGKGYGLRCGTGAALWAAYDAAY